MEIGIGMVVIMMDTHMYDWLFIPTKRVSSWSEPWRLEGMVVIMIGTHMYIWLFIPTNRVSSGIEAWRLGRDGGNNDWYPHGCLVLHP